MHNLNLRRLSLTILTLTFVLVSSAALSHSRLFTPVPRSSTDAGLQGLLDSGGLDYADPCGPPDLIPVGAATATWVADSDQEIIIDHRVNHGVEKLQFFVSYDGGATFGELRAPSQFQSGSISYVEGGLPAPDGRGIRSFLVKAPPNKSDSVVLRYTDGTYFSCADIEVTGSGIGVDLIFDNGFESGGSGD